ncbi:sigma-70 family RNA polymerase sigma factor [Amycolatopsis jiangsuensis]|uniref:sigma-70 family RNA polymerase sigma factor n=1 Tax=Amycolatopsis jiangsuensis TaxID=1181879 RepID=UPI001620A40A
MLRSAEFAGLADPFRRELLVFCYRMVGSVDEAEDLVQEVYLRAWRSYASFEGRSSLRTWLYRIATNACLTALEHRSRRPLPSGLGAPSEDPAVPLTLAGPEASWLQPLPDVAGSADPAAIVTARDSLRLALTAALQLLPPRQRAVLILRDVLAWPAAEVAELLGSSTAAVKSMLQRARALIERVAPREDQLVHPGEPGVRAMVDQYMAAFEHADVAALVRLLRADVELEMPPFVTWFSGREAVARFAESHILGAPGELRMVVVGANGQPAVAAYRSGADGVHRAHAVHVLTPAGDGIARIVAFLGSDLFRRFELPMVHAATADAAG